MTAVLQIPGDRDQWEREDRRAVLLHVRNGDVVVEGGVGSGTVTKALLDAGAQVYGFEPRAEELRHLWPWVERKPFTPVVSAEALGRITGESRLPEGKEWWESGGFGGSGRKVQVRNALDVLEEFRPDGLVLDIEGAEHDILRGLGAFRPRWIVAELHPRAYPDISDIDATIVALAKRFPRVNVYYRKVNAVIGCE